MLEVARPDEHGEAVRREILRYLKTDSFVGPGDQGDGFVLHSNLLFCIDVWPTPPCCKCKRCHSENHIMILMSNLPEEAQFMLSYVLLTRISVVRYCLSWWWIIRTPLLTA